MCPRSHTGLCFSLWNPKNSVNDKFSFYIRCRLIQVICFFLGEFWQLVSLKEVSISSELRMLLLWGFNNLLLSSLSFSICLISNICTLFLFSYLAWISGYQLITFTDFFSCCFSVSILFTSGIIIIPFLLLALDLICSFPFL